ncbi:MAG: hypothetical protein KJ645_01805 [Planctomycetes bacterium]|nr:hypothetical protein [Planctomycetota bacterium]
MNDNVLPNDEQKAKLAKFVRLAFIEIRAISAEGRCKQASDLADAFHNMPREIYGCGKWSKSLTRGMMQDYQNKYHDEDYSPKYDYVSAFDDIFAV